MVLASIVLGSSIIEKHFTINPKAKGPDHPHSMDPKSFSKMVQDIRTLEKALGTGIKKEKKSEKETKKWLTISSELGNQILDWEGNENVHANLWQKQLHLYEVPFYYVEYGMAQLGAIAMWRSYKQIGEKGLDNYMDALKLGYTKTIGEIYETAGIKFDFSARYVKELANFIKEELEKLR